MRRCRHESGCLSEIVNGRGQYFFENGRIVIDCSDDRTTGVWESKCDDCGLVVRGRKDRGPKWLQERIATQEEYSWSDFLGASPGERR
jgi:hypothetical protein